MQAYKPMDQIESGNVVDKIIAELTGAFASGRFSAGEKLPNEFELTKELGVSRNSLREAIKILSALGVVEIRRGEGTYICSEPKPSIFDSFAYSILLERSNSEEIVELRQILDEDVLVMAVQKCTQEQIEWLKANIAEMEQHFETGDLSKAAQTDYDFHIYLAECIQNRFLVRIVKGVYAFFKSSIEKNIRTEELFADAVSHHQEIVECLEKRDPAMVHEVVQHSLSSWRKDIQDKI